MIEINSLDILSENIREEVHSIVDKETNQLPWNLAIVKIWSAVYTEVNTAYIRYRSRYSIEISLANYLWKT